MEFKNRRLIKALPAFCVNPLILVFSAVIFGFSTVFTAWFIFTPLIVLIHRISLKKAALYGGLYGILSYFFLVTWLLRFSAAAFAGVSLLYCIWWIFIFLILKIIYLKLPKYYWILFCFILVLYEFFKAKGIFGFSYGITAYTQYRNIYFIQFTDLFGVIGVSAVLIFSSCVAAKILIDKSFKKNIISILILFLFIICAYCYGFFRITMTDRICGNTEKIRVTAIQNNSDPWKTGLKSYEEDLSVLKKLTDLALVEYPDTDLIVWSETAVVPSIMKNYYNEFSERFILVRDLLNYIDGKNCAFLIGNYHVEQEAANIFEKNAAFLFIPNQNVIPPLPEIYAKIHFVPFAEYFPYKKQFPFIYNVLLNGDTHFWTKGEDIKVFEYKGLKFSTPICFEDNFPTDCKKFVSSGARAFINISNDSWAKSLKCQTQHLQTAVFRSVENHIPSVRSTASGQTCIIDSSGRIISMSEPFAENFVSGYIPLLKY